jgi:dienelactone hydrolase
MAFLLPTGPLSIGSIVHEFVDDTRPTRALGVERGRRIVLKCWYPADAPRGSRPELIWQELRADSAVPVLGRGLLAFLRQRTSSHSGAPFAARAERSPLVLYNHGLVSFAAENTSLAEELASHGCTVVSLQHAEQLAEFRELEARQSAAKKRSAATLAAALRKATGEARARLAVEYYVASENTGRIVVERAADTSFVLDRVHELIARIPGAPAPAIGTARPHLAGFSVGGAVATECAKRDARVASVVNLDGGMQGTPGEGEIRVPYLMMYSAANEAMNAALLPSSARPVTLPGTAHLNYHDVAVLVPGLRLLRAVGTADARAILPVRNRAVVEFYRSVGALGV